MKRLNDFTDADIMEVALEARRICCVHMGEQGFSKFTKEHAAFSETLAKATWLALKQKMRKEGYL